MPIGDLRYNIWNPKSEKQREWLGIALHIALRCDVKPEVIHPITQKTKQPIEYLKYVWDRCSKGKTLDLSEIVLSDNHYYQMFTHGLNPADLTRRLIEFTDIGAKNFPFPFTEYLPLTKSQMIDAIFLETLSYQFQKSIVPHRENLFAAVYTPSGAQKLLDYYNKNKETRLRGAWCFLPLVKSFDREAVEKKCDIQF